MEPARLKALLATRAPGHKPALAFERSHGHLRIRGWLIGAGACLSAKEMTYAPAGTHQLVPVVATDNDNVFFLAADGTAWAQDTIEDPAPVKFAATAKAMWAKLSAQFRAFDSPDPKTLRLAGKHGTRVAKILGAKKFPDASDRDATWWSDGTVYVVERGGETVVSWATKAQIAAVRKALGVAPPGKESVGTTFDEVNNAGDSMCVVIPDLRGTPAENYESFLPLAQARGTITALEPGVRIGLNVGGERVEIFFRQPLVSTLVNIYQFTKKVDAAEKAWRAVAEPWAATRAK